MVLGTVNGGNGISRWTGDTKGQGKHTILPMPPGIFSSGPPSGSCDSCTFSPSQLLFLWTCPACSRTPINFQQPTTSSGKDFHVTLDNYLLCKESPPFVSHLALLSFIGQPPVSCIKGTWTVRIQPPSPWFWSSLSSSSNLFYGLKGPRLLNWKLLQILDQPFCCSVKVRDTHSRHLCKYSSGVLRVQIFPFKLPILSISCETEVKEGRMNEQAGRERGLAAWGRRKVVGKKVNWLWGVIQTTAKAKGSWKRAQPQLTRKRNKKMEKGVRRNAMSQTPLWEPPETEGRKMQTGRGVMVLN